MDNQCPSDLARLVKVSDRTCQLADKLHKTFIKKFEKRKVYLPFKNNILRANLVGMQLISKFDQGIHFLLCVLIIIVNMYDFFL